jgi:chromate reductase, NAD(P)H dehydrogenase (quinone)
MSKQFKILGIPGSLRSKSYNRSALIAASELAPEGVEVNIFDLHGIPPFNEDDEKNVPSKVIELKNEIGAADAILFATPEYNYSFSGVLKNAIDWASRPYGESAWEGKPAAIMGASIALAGTARAQYHLRQVCVTLNMFPINKPEVMIGNASESFSPDGKLTDEATRKRIEKLLHSLIEWSKRLK